MTHLLLRTARSGAFGVPTVRRDEWAACRQRAASLLRTQAYVLPLIFGLIFGVADAAIAENSEGWVLTTVLAALLVVRIGAGNLKFWLVLYPVVFLAPRFKFGDWSEAGEKLFGIQLYEPWILLIVILWLPAVLAAKRLSLPWSVKVPLVVFAGIALFATWIAPDRALAMRVGGRNFVEPLLLFVVFTSLSWQTVELRRCVFVLLGVGAVVCVSGILGYWTDPSLPTHGLKRLQSSWEGANIQAAFVGAVIPVGVAAMLRATSRTAALGSATALGLAFTALVLTSSRGAWIGLVLGLAFLLGHLRAWAWAGLAGLAIWLGVLLGPPEILERAVSIVNFEQDPSASSRLKLWPEVVGLIEERPITGYGFGAFQVLFSERVNIQSLHAHNLILDFAVNLGIPATVVFVWLVGYILQRGLSTASQRRQMGDALLLAGLCGSIVSILTAGMFDGSILSWPILAHTFWFVLALTYAATIAVERDFFQQ